jgi:oligopeptide/dipeptide ABC transporter ATP-binding protein
MMSDHDPATMIDTTAPSAGATATVVAPATAVPASSLALSLRDFRVSFPTMNGVVQAVRGVDIDVAAGEMLAVVGESGSGKSVTFLGLMGLLPPTTIITGSARLGDVELVGADSKVARRVRGKKIAMIFQDPLSALNPVLRIGKQIEEMIHSHQKLSKDEGATRAVELLDLVGIPQPKERARQYPHEFSGGMRQRVMIAMAIANDPEVLIADEPTTALDVTVQAQILEVIQRIQRDLSTAVVLITHDLGVVARVAERVHVMYAGRAAERATVDTLFVDPTHPYTVGLLNSLPRLGVERLEPIKGSPPNMLRPPSGCAFRPRCIFAAPQCAGDIPSLRPFHQSETACVRIEEIDLKATEG